VKHLEETTAVAKVAISEAPDGYDPHTIPLREKTTLIGAAEAAVAEETGVFPVVKEEMVVVREEGSKPVDEFVVSERSEEHSGLIYVCCEPSLS
jgi:hypothetical protein